MTYKKGLIKATILQIVSDSNFPVTVGYIYQNSDYSLSTIKDTMKRLELDRCIECRTFRSAGINSSDFRIGQKGKSPKYFYVFREPEGGKKMCYFHKIGLI